MDQVIIQNPKRLFIILGIMVTVFVLFWTVNIKAQHPFLSCAEAKAEGFSNIPRTSPYYNPHLDRDKDGIACE